MRKDMDKREITDYEGMLTDETQTMTVMLLQTAMWELSITGSMHRGKVQ